MTDLPTVGDYMAKSLTTFKPEDSIHSAVKILLEKRFSGAPVIDENGQLAGLISKKDCLSVVYAGSFHKEWSGQVQDYMNTEIEFIDVGTDIIAAADRFVQSRFRRFPVMSDGKLVGLISRHDILRALNDQWDD